MVIRWEDNVLKLLSHVQPILSLAVFIICFLDVLIHPNARICNLAVKYTTSLHFR